MLLEVDNISKSFEGKKVLEGISFSLDKGQAIALTGGNGTGKTTLLRIITRLIEPDAGNVLYDGHPLSDDDKKQIGYLPEERGLYRHMAAGEQAMYLAQLKGMSKCEAREKLQWWFDHMRMADWWGRYPSHLSKGMQQRLQFVVSVAHNPQLLILDEPFSGFDAANAELLQSELERLKSNGTAIILSTHNMQAVSSLCDNTIRL